MTQLEDDDSSLIPSIYKCLNEITDPCSVVAGAPAGLVDMGLVSEVSVERTQDGRRRAVVKIGVTHPFCMMAGIFIKEVRERVSQISLISDVAVALDENMLWTPELMTEEYKERIGQVRRRSGLTPSPVGAVEPLAITTIRWLPSARPH